MHGHGSFKAEDRRPASPDGAHGATAEAVETWEGEGGTPAGTQRASTEDPAKQPGPDVRRKAGKDA